MLSLPTNTELRNLFETATLVHWKELPTFRNALIACRNTISSDPVSNGANSVCIRSDGEIWLVSVGPNGGWKKLWNFGNPIT